MRQVLDRHTVRKAPRIPAAPPMSRFMPTMFVGLPPCIATVTTTNTSATTTEPQKTNARTPNKVHGLKTGLAPHSRDAARTPSWTVHQCRTRCWSHGNQQGGQRWSKHVQTTATTTHDTHPLPTRTMSCLLRVESAAGWITHGTTHKAGPTAVDKGQRMSPQRHDTIRRDSDGQSRF